MEYRWTIDGVSSEEERKNIGGNSSFPQTFFMNYGISFLGLGSYMIPM